MIRDITNEINSAFSCSLIWDRDKFFTYLNQITHSIQGGILDWDEYAGENWGRVLIQEEPIIYFYRHSPLVFVQQRFRDVVVKYSDLHCIVFSNADEESYSLDANFFEQWSKGRSKTGGLKNNSLSVSDIWWATVL
jgi:hypothetical protein